MKRQQRGWTAEGLMGVHTGAEYLVWLTALETKLKTEGGVLSVCWMRCVTGLNLKPICSTLNLLGTLLPGSTWMSHSSKASPRKCWCQHMWNPVINPFPVNICQAQICIRQLKHEWKLTSSSFEHKVTDSVQINQFHVQGDAFISPSVNAAVLTSTI